jgi:hypothetical protein
MKRIFGVALGILTAIGGFVDIGDLVTNAVVGSRFGLGLAWVVLVGVVGICVYAQMSGRVAAVSGRATFEIIRERLGPRAGLANLAASFLPTSRHPSTYTTSRSPPRSAAWHSHSSWRRASIRGSGSRSPPSPCGS